MAVLKYKSGGTWYDLTVGMDQAAADARYVNVSGDAMTGALDLAGNPYTGKDTGVRNIAGLITGGWTLVAGGWIHIRRVNWTVFLEIGGIKNTSGTPGVAISAILGFTPYGYALNPGWDFYGTSAFAGYLALGDFGVAVYGYTANKYVYGTVVTHTRQAWPVSLPGAPVSLKQARQPLEATR